MAQRESGYARQEHDSYWTPQWVYDALYTVEDFFEAIDIAPRVPNGYDFLAQCGPIVGNIATNPPFSLSEQFCKKAIQDTELLSGKVAMLLPVTFDTAHSRRYLFEHSPFKVKYTLTKRIRWDNLEQKKNGPSTNHAWFIWDWSYTGRPFMGWLP